MPIRNLKITRTSGALFVDGEQVSRHRTEVEAVEHAVSHLEQGAIEVFYHPGIMRVEADVEGLDVVPEEPTEPPAGAVLRSSFENGDILDGGKFFNQLDADALLDVVPWPHGPGNCLEIRYADGGAGLIGASGWYVPVGSTVTYKMTLANHLEVGANVSTDHGIQSNIGMIEQCLVITGGIAGGWGIGWAHNDRVGGHRSFIYYSDLLPKNTPLEVEWALIRTSETEAALLSFTVTNLFNSEVLANEDSMTGFVNSVGEGRPLSDMGVIEMTDTGFNQMLFGSSGSGSGAQGVTYLTDISITVE